MGLGMVVGTRGVSGHVSAEVPSSLRGSEACRNGYLNEKIMGCMQNQHKGSQFKFKHYCLIASFIYIYIT